MNKIYKQSGSVSLFVVIFATLLITVVTVSFVRIMVQSQQQASSTDLSQSAYDSAQAGVEDAKRALLRYQSICNQFGQSSIECDNARIAIDSLTTGCNDAVLTLSDVGVSDDEVKININGNDNKLDQAYTCVKIITQTDDYTGLLIQDSSKFIPLVGVTDFDSIKIEWFNLNDKTNSSVPFDIPTVASGTSLLSQDNWTVTKINRPSIMRAQLIQFNSSGFSIGDFETNTSVNGSNNTLFLYPSTIVAATKNFSDNVRKTAISAPVQINCSSDALNYSCSSTVLLPKQVKDADHTQYLNLTSLYKSAHYRITLWNAGVPVKFDNIQPAVDSTGRANDLFRRVQSRVELTNINFPYPAAEINITGNLCKDFAITDDPAVYNNSIAANGCTP